MHLFASRQEKALLMASEPKISAFQLRLPSLAARKRPQLVPPPPPPPSGEREEVRRIRASLEASIAAAVSNGAELIDANGRTRRNEFLPTMLAPLDTLLGGGIRRGALIEISGRRCSGRFSILISTLAAATSAGETCVLIDLGDHFDPAIGSAAGIELERLLWIRPESMKHAVMAVEMISAAGFPLVVLDAGMHPLRGRRVADTSWVRLARTAETHRTALLLSTPYPLAGTASEAVIRAQRATSEWKGKGPAPRLLSGSVIHLTVEKQRHQRSGRNAMLRFHPCESVDAQPVAASSKKSDPGESGGRERRAV